MKTLATFALLLMIATATQASSFSFGNGTGTVEVKDSVAANPGDNAATNQLNLSMKNKKGEIMLQQNVLASNSAIEVKLPQMPAGLYLLSVKSGAKAQNQKFVIR